MKKLTFILCTCLALSGMAKAQEVEILLLGTQHEFQDSLLDRQNFETIRMELAQFNPNIICIESIPLKDTASLNEVRSKQIEVASRLKQEKQLATNEALVEQLLIKLNQNPDDLLVRSELANQLYANHDFWNAYYHYFILGRNLPNATPTDFSGLRKSFALDSMHTRIHQREKFTEYGNVVFPLADFLNQPYLVNIDYRADEAEFLKRVKRAFIGTIFNLKIFKLKKRFKQQEKAMLEAERNGELIEFINAPEQRAFYLDMIDNSHRFLKSKNMRRVVALWELRNEIMAQRILDAAFEQKANRVLVTVGAFHIPFIQRYLEANERIKVITYDQLQTNLSVKN